MVKTEAAQAFPPPPSSPSSRPMSYSVGQITTFVMPHMQNIRGDLFGGELMALVDQAAAVAAIRHAGGPAVTASIERVDFRERIPVGALVTCAATVDYVGNSSMDITVEVYAERVSSGEKRHTHTAHVVFVALDEDGKPKRVPRLIPETEEEQARYARAESHRQGRA
jgi:acyl-CoA hydrolase